MTRAELKRIQKLPLNELHNYLNGLTTNQTKITLDYSIKCLYSTICNVLYEKEGFGKVRLERTLTEMESRMNQGIPDADKLAKEVKERFNISIGGV